jgi:hypothetical protein
LAGFLHDAWTAPLVESSMVMTVTEFICSLLLRRSYELPVAKAAPNFGLTTQSQRAFIHFAVVYDIPDFKERVRRLFR